MKVFNRIGSAAIALGIFFGAPVISPAPGIAEVTEADRGRVNALVARQNMPAWHFEWPTIGDRAIYTAHFSSNVNVATVYTSASGEETVLPPSKASLDVVVGNGTKTTHGSTLKVDVGHEGGVRSITVEVSFSGVGSFKDAIRRGIKDEGAPGWAGIKVVGVVSHVRGPQGTPASATGTFNIDMDDGSSYMGIFVLDQSYAS